MVEPHSELGETLSYRYQSLSYNLTDKLMSPFLVEIPPSESAEVTASTHGGEEFLFVLAGQLEVQVGGETHRMEPGDAIYFDSRLEHSLRAVEGTSVRLLACVAEGRAQLKDNPIGRAYG
jgi:quercetin dioxygenase-like cupin family protein